MTFSPLDWTLDQMRRTEAMLVANDRRHQRRVIALDVAMWLLGMAALVAYPWVAGGWRFACGVMLGVMMGRLTLTGLKRAQAYRRGWLHGRQAMTLSMLEAMRRGMSLDEWVVAEMRRDQALLGVDTDSGTPNDLP